MVFDVSHEVSPKITWIAASNSQPQLLQSMFWKTALVLSPDFSVVAKPQAPSLCLTCLVATQHPCFDPSFLVFLLDRNSDFRWSQSATKPSEICHFFEGYIHIISSPRRGMRSGSYDWPKSTLSHTVTAMAIAAMGTLSAGRSSEETSRLAAQMSPGTDLCRRVWHQGA